MQTTGTILKMKSLFTSKHFDCMAIINIVHNAVISPFFRVFVFNLAYNTVMDCLHLFFFFLSFLSQPFTAIKNCVSLCVDIKFLLNTL